MRSLIIRFADYEGPAYLEELLRKKGFGITFHDSYKMGLKLIDNSHLVFDLIILMGGPQSVYEDSLKSFFEPFKELVLNSYNNPKSKIIGICLGSQVIAEAFGSKVYRGGAGEEVGFGKCKILSKENPIFSGLEGDEVNVFHLHGDTFEIPEKSEHLLSSEKYPSQMFVIENKVFGLQCHMEVTESLLNVWKDKLPSVKNCLPGSNDLKNFTEAVNKDASIIFENILNL